MGYDHYYYFYACDPQYPIDKKKELFAVVCKYVCIDAVNTVHNLMLSFYVFNELMLFPWLFWYHVGRKNEDKYIFDVSMSCCESIWVN